MFQDKKKQLQTTMRMGKIKSIGQTYTYQYLREQKSIPKKYSFGEIQKKIKKWENIWNQDGQLHRVEHYKLVKA